MLPARPPAQEAAPAAPEPKAQPAEVPVDYRALYEKERQRADSMQGLYQSRMDEYRQRVEAAERQRAEQPAVPGFEPDEIEKEEIEAFRKKHPEIAKDTVDGKKAVGQSADVEVDRRQPWTEPSELQGR